MAKRKKTRFPEYWTEMDGDGEGEVYSTFTSYLEFPTGYLVRTVAGGPMLATDPRDTPMSVAMAFVPKKLKQSDKGSHTPRSG